MKDFDRIDSEDGLLGEFGDWMERTKVSVTGLWWISWWSGLISIYVSIHMKDFDRIGSEDDLRGEFGDCMERTKCIRNRTMMEQLMARTYV